MTKINLNDLYKYSRFIYTCELCNQQLPVWMVSDIAWKRGVKKLTNMIEKKYNSPEYGYSRCVGRKLVYLCKSCFELANPNPEYQCFDAYMNKYYPSTGSFHVPDDYREIMKKVWSMETELTKEEHTDELRYLYEPTDKEFNAGRLFRAFRRLSPATQDFKRGLRNATIT